MNKERSDAHKVVAMEKSHSRKKEALGHRVQVLRVLIRNYYKEKQLSFLEGDFVNHCEAVLDNMLSRFSYDLEMIIDSWRNIVPELKQQPITCEKCGYRPVFCRC
jgi:hypothetical protein